MYIRIRSISSITNWSRNEIGCSLVQHGHGGKLPEYHTFSTGWKCCLHILSSPTVAEPSMIYLQEVTLVNPVQTRIKSSCSRPGTLPVGMDCNVVRADRKFCVESESCRENRAANEENISIVGDIEDQFPYAQAHSNQQPQQRPAEHRSLLYTRGLHQPCWAVYLRTRELATRLVRSLQSRGGSFTARRLVDQFCQDSRNRSCGSSDIDDW